MRRELVSVREPNDSVAAVRGGATVIDLQDPRSALGTPYPMNILAACDGLHAEGFSNLLISINSGEEQRVHCSMRQAVLGIAAATSSDVTCGFAGFHQDAGFYLGRNPVRTVKQLRPRCTANPTVFSNEEFSTFFAAYLPHVWRVEADLLCAGPATRGPKADLVRLGNVTTTCVRTLFRRIP